MQKNEYLVAKIGVATAENEPPKVSSNFFFTFPSRSFLGRGPAGHPRRDGRGAPGGETRAADGPRGGRAGRSVGG